MTPPASIDRARNVGETSSSRGMDYLRSDRAAGRSAASSYRPDIDGLRALAIIPVVIFHAFPGWMRGGFVGVDIFFVISGFLISTIILQGLERGTFTFSGFYANRIRRIFPALMVVLAACFVIGWFFLLPDEYQLLGKHITGAAAYIENFVLRREAGYFDIRSSLKPLMHIWSLGIEEQFYITYPLFLWLAFRGRRYLGPILFSVAVASFLMNVWFVRRDSVGDFFLPQTRCWELLAGGILAYYGLSGGNTKTAQSGSIPPWARFLPRNKEFLALTGLLLLVIAIFWIRESDNFPGWWALVPVSGAALLILAGPQTWVNRKVLSNKVAVFIGLISYPLYLWHWPVLSLGRIVRGEELSVTSRWAGVALSFGLAWATWKFVEKPIRFGRKTWSRTAGLVVCSLVIAGLGYTAYSQEGFIRRFPSLPRDLGKFQQEAQVTPDCRQRLGSPDLDYCRSTATGSEDVILIGDSHAASLYRGLGPAYRNKGHVVLNLAQAGCAPLYDTESSGAHQDSGCAAVVNRMLDFAATDKTAQTIILSFRGPENMYGRGFGPAEAGRPVKALVWKGTSPATSQPEMFAGALADTVSRLYASGKSVVLFIDWPELGFDPRSCLSRPVTLFSAVRPVCGVARPEMDERNREYRTLVMGLQQKFSGLRVFDPIPFLCDSSACYAMSSGHLLYRDDNHLSLAGASFLGEKFVEQELATRPAQRAAEVEPSPHP